MPAHAAKTIMVANAHCTGPLPANKPPSPEKEPITGARASALKSPVGACVSTV